MVPFLTLGEFASYPFIFWGHCFHMVTLGQLHQTVKSFHLPNETGILNRAHMTTADGVCLSQSLIIEGKTVNSLNISCIFECNFIFREVKCNHDFIVQILESKALKCSWGMRSKVKIQIYLTESWSLLSTSIWLDLFYLVNDLMSLLTRFLPLCSCIML